jgi:hypothetical protein
MERWPTELPETPKVGQLIDSATRHGAHFRLALRVVEVKWTYAESTRTWSPEVWLSVPRENQSIHDFFHWYAPMVGKPVGAFI